MHAANRGLTLRRLNRSWHQLAESGQRHTQVAYAAPPAGPSPNANSVAVAGAAPPAPGQVLELECADLAFGGEGGICRLPGGFVVFVDRALPGERLTARVVHSKKRFAKATKLTTLRQHDAPAEPACQHFGPCGGCSLQSLDYAAQLQTKHRQVADLLRRTAGVSDADSLLRPIVGCPPDQQYAYRNKMEFSFSNCSSTDGSALGRRGRRRVGGSGGGAGSLELGLKRPGSHTAVLPVERCHLQSDAANQLLQRVLQLCRQHGLQAHDPHTRTGLLQHVVIRKGTANPSSGPSSGPSIGSGPTSSSGRAVAGPVSEEYLVNFVTASDGRRELAPLAHALMLADGRSQGQRQQAPVVVGVVNSVSQRGRPVGERRLAAEHVLAGRGFLTERLGGLELEVSANSFFQTNTRQADVLYRLVAQAAELRPSDVLLDLYCGTGSIGLSLAAACAQVHGVELSAAAVADAARNAARNGVANAAFIQGDLHSLQLEGRLPRPDVVVVDPARAGLAPAVVRYLRRCGARRLVYVSCDAATQARDIALLCSGGSDGCGEAGDGGCGSGGDAGGGGSGSSGAFRLASLQACDLYPHTWHVETVAVLDAVGEAACEA